MAHGQIDIAKVQAVLNEFSDPETGRGIWEMEQVADLRLDEDSLSLKLLLATHSAPLRDTKRQELVEFLKRKLPDLDSLTVELGTLDRPPQPLGEIGLRVKSVIAVASGKGGVGKSTIAATLAYALQRAGSRVGLMDADVYGPSVPHLLGLEGKPEVEENKIKPIYKGELSVMSMGFLVPPGEAVVWRGPMLHGAITQFLRDTSWGELDYLIIDMPPGTGDIALTLSQLLPLTGAVVVCTPQDVALLDAVKAIAMFRKVNIPILGMVENMSGFVCTQCGHLHEIFGVGGARQRAEELDVPFLGAVPINLGIRLSGDEGCIESVFDDPATAVPLERVSYGLVNNLAVSHAKEPPLPPLTVL